MRTLFLILISGIILISCHKEIPDLLDQNIAAYIAQNATDPGSYQPVSTKIIDTVFVQKFTAGLIDLNNDEIKMIEKDIENLQKIATDLQEQKADKKAAAVTAKIEEARESIEKIRQNNARIKPLLDKDEIAFIRVEHDCKLNNAKGKLVDDHLFMLVDKDMNILYVKEKGRRNSYQTIDFFKEKYLK